MIKLQIRVKPKNSLLDIDIPLIEKRLTSLADVEEVKIFDDRASDAPFITVVVTLVDSSKDALSSLRACLLHLPKMEPCIVDEHGEEIGCGLLSLKDLKHYAKLL